MGLVEVKKKSFSFDETDLEWINPLLIEWVKENEGKKQGDLIVQLLRDFKLERERVFIEDDSQAEVITSVKKEKLNYFERVRKVLNIIFDKLESHMRRLLNELQKGYKELMGNIRRLEARERVRTVLSNVFDKLESSVRRLFTRTREEVRETRVEELEAEIKRLQTMVNEMKAEPPEHGEEEEEGNAYEAETLAEAHAN